MSYGLHVIPLILSGNSQLPGVKEQYGNHHHLKLGTKNKKTQQSSHGRHSCVSCGSSVETRPKNQFSIHHLLLISIMLHCKFQLNPSVSLWVSLQLKSTAWNTPVESYELELTIPTRIHVRQCDHKMSCKVNSKMELIPL